ncbi:MAG: hypothetical protein D6741_01030, partial [Planctomycetota bacterium]
MTTPFDDSKHEHANDELEHLEQASGDDAASPESEDDGMLALSEDGLDGIPESEDFAVVKESETASEADTTPTSESEEEADGDAARADGDEAADG